MCDFNPTSKQCLWVVLFLNGIQRDNYEMDLDTIQTKNITSELIRALPSILGLGLTLDLTKKGLQ